MSKLSAYTVPIEDRMRVKHGVQARFTVKSGRLTLEDRLNGVDSLGGAMTMAGVIYNRLSYSGGVSWWNPSTGKPLAQAPKVTMRVRPEDVLTGEQMCDCRECQREYGKPVSTLGTGSRILESEGKKS